MESIVEKLPNEAIILVRVRPHASSSPEEAEVAAACAALIDGDGPHYRITDFSAFEMTFSGLIQGMSQEKQRIPGSVSDPRLRNIFVGTQDMIALGAHSFKQAQYGGLDVMLFATLDDALDYARAHLGAAV